jgi:hypothetical protein
LVIHLCLIKNLLNYKKFSFMLILFILNKNLVNYWFSLFEAFFLSLTWLFI